MFACLVSKVCANVCLAYYFWVHYKSYLLLAETYGLRLQACRVGTCLGEHGYLDFSSDCGFYLYDHEYGHRLGAAVCTSVWDSQGSV